MPNFYHQKLKVYDKALDFIVAIDKVVEGWPSYRRYLGLQMRRAASSIALNIAEGAHEISRKDKHRLYRYAKRSAGECVCVLDIAVRLQLNTDKELAPFYEALNEIIAMLTQMAKP